MNQIPFMTAREIAQRVRAGEFSPTKVVEAHLERIAALQPKLNAFAHVDGDRAFAAARRLQRELAGGHAGALCGVPVSIKSSIDVATLRCEAGSRLRQGSIPSADAPLVQRLKAAGAIVLGTTNTPEMLAAYETDNLLYGRTSNPWDLERTAGGSSGGEAAAIAAGMTVCGVGSDGGGSIRVPAHFTGICGLKPTPGRIPATGHFPECAGPWAITGVVGPMARTVADLRLLWRVLAGPDDGDPMAAPVADPGPKELTTSRVALLDIDGVTPDTRSTVERAASLLQGAGVTVEPLCFADFDRALELWQMVFCSAGALAVRAFAAGGEELLSPIVRDFLDYAQQRAPLTVESLLFGLVERDQVRARVLRQMRPYSALLAPVSSGPAFRHGDGGWGPSHPANYIETMRYSQFPNIMGLPAAAVPAGRSAEGLPIGIQVIGLPYEETTVLDFAEAIAGAGEFAWPAIAQSSRGSGVHP